MRQSSRWVRADGLSLVELVIAVALLGIISAALQFPTDDRNQDVWRAVAPNKKAKERGPFRIHLQNFRLANSPTRLSRGFMRTPVPEDLRAGPGVTLVTTFDNSSRFNGVDPRSTLVGDANPATGQFKI